MMSISLSHVSLNDVKQRDRQNPTVPCFDLVPKPCSVSIQFVVCTLGDLGKSVIKYDGDYHKLKGYSSGQSHFSEINVKLAEKNKYATHSVQRSLEMCENKEKPSISEDFRQKMFYQ